MKTGMFVHMSSTVMLTVCDWNIDRKVDILARITKSRLEAPPSRSG